MCDICRRNPCSKHCPNSTEKPLNVCDSCGDDIFEGEHFFEVTVEGYQTFNICEECMDSFGKYAEVDEPNPDDYKEE